MSRKAFERIRAGLDEALEIARGNKEPAEIHHFIATEAAGRRKAVRAKPIEPPSVQRVKLFNFDKPRRVFGKLESVNNRLHGAVIKPDGDAA